MATNTKDDTTTAQDDDEYYVPLVDQRVFGAGLKRKRVAFVPAASDDSVVKQVKSSSDAGNRYLSIVLPQKSAEVPQGLDMSIETGGGLPKSDADNEPLSKVGTLPNPNSNRDTSIAHQLNIEHSHPPSHLDRTRLGMRYLQEYGWDPDDRQGLGSRREGIRIPVKATQKSDTAGLGLFVKNDDEIDTAKKKTLEQNSKNSSTPRLNAKQVRKLEDDKRTKGEKLRQSVYGEDWSRYLGSE